MSHQHILGVVLPAFVAFLLLPFVDQRVSFGGAAMAAQPAPQSAPAKISADGETPGSSVEVRDIKRGSGGTVMLRFTLVNDTDKNISFGNDLSQKGINESGTVGGVHLIDTVGKKKYLVVRDSQKVCDCSRQFYVLKAKSQVNLWARFPAPPDNVEKVSVVIPRFEPLDDVPITR